MKWIGLTGGIATGKSTVSRFLRQRGLPVVDADQLARDAVVPGSPAFTEILRAFGLDLRMASGGIDRKKLGALVFSDPLKLRTLETLVHPRVRELADEARSLLERQGHPLAFYDVPLLFEKKMENLFDRIVVVSSSRASQIERATTRDGLKQSDVERRLQSQLPLAEKEKLADHVLVNDGTLDELKVAVDDLLVEIG